MLDQTTKQKIDSARQILVGKIPDPKAQVDQITTALVYKFMDDMDKKSEELGGEASFFTNSFSSYSWTKLLDKKLSGQERLDLYIQAITNMSKNPHIPQLFRDIFKSAFLPFRDPRTLTLFLKEINEFSYDHSENLGNAFEYLLSILGSQGKAGQFRTPRHIIDFIAEVIDPKKNETILDPACGTAGFLISAYKHILKKHDGIDNKIGKLTNQEKNLTPDEKKRLMRNIVGYDISPDMVKLSLVNMYLHGFQNPQIHEYDSLTSEKHWDEIFDIIMANPPFMTPKGGIQPHKRFSIQSSRTEVLFVDYILEHLKIDGRGAVIVPDGIVSNTNASFYNKLRETLIKDSYLWAVVSMPSGIFRPYATAKTTILFLDRKTAKQKDKILFINLKHDGFDLGEQRKKIEENDIPEIIESLNLYKTGKKNSFKNNLTVKKSEIAATKTYLLSGDYYAHRSSKKSTKYKYVPLRNILKESTAKIKDSKIPTSKIEPLSITMKDGLVKQSEKFNKRIANKDISGYKLVEKGQLVVGFPIDEGVLDILQIADYGAVSPAYSVWDIDNCEELDLDYFNLVIKSAKAIEIYKKLMNRTANRRRSIRKDVFLNIEIPIPPDDLQRQAVQLLKKATEMRIETNALVERSKELVNNSWT